MKDSKKKSLKGCAIGCGVMVLLLPLGLGTTTWFTFRGYGEALRARQTLDGTYATQASYTPSPDGSIPVERMQRFLAVRRALMPFCERATAHQQVFERLSGYERTDQPPPMKEVVADLGRAVKGIFRIGYDFGDYVTKRNQALLEHEMGLGEYTWIYVTSYFSWLGHRPVRIIEQKDRPRVFHDRIFHEIRGMIERHVAEHPATADPAAWHAELEALRGDVERIPFEDGLPPELEASLLPFRDELVAVACPAACELEVVRTEKAGFRYDHR
ncbi:MAG: hypothetical protein GY856_34020 [bacterium]|nr:hypothetical protein [bacterium]